MAVGTGSLAQEPRDAPVRALGLGLGQGVLHRRNGRVVGEVELGSGVGPLVVDHDVALLRGPVEHDLALLRRQLVKGDVGAHAHLAANVLHERPHERAPHHHGTLVDGLGLVGHERGLVHHTHDPGAPAGGAGTVAVEGKVLRAATVELRPAGGTDDGTLQRHVHGGWAAVPVGAGVGAHAREEQAQPVEQLRGRAKGRAHPRHGGALPQGERRWHVLDQVDVRPGALRDAPPRVGGERLEVAAAALGVQRPQCQARLARARHAGDSHELAQRHVHVDVLKVVDARTSHAYAGRSVLCHEPSPHAPAADARGGGHQPSNGKRYGSPSSSRTSTSSRCTASPTGTPLSLRSSQARYSFSPAV
jgi:hypothetical protein